MAFNKMINEVLDKNHVKPSSQVKDTRAKIKKMLHYLKLKQICPDNILQFEINRVPSNWHSIALKHHIISIKNTTPASVLSHPNQVFKSFGAIENNRRVTVNYVKDSF